MTGAALFLRPLLPELASSLAVDPLELVLREVPEFALSFRETQRADRVSMIRHRIVAGVPLLRLRARFLRKSEVLRRKVLALLWSQLAHAAGVPTPGGGLVPKARWRTRRTRARFHPYTKRMA